MSEGTQVLKQRLNQFFVSSAQPQSCLCKPSLILDRTVLTKADYAMQLAEDGEEVVKCSSGQRRVESETAGKLLFAVVDIWFCYVYPTVLLGIGLLKRGTVACGIYYLLASFLVGSARLPHGNPRNWRRIHMILVTLSIILFIVACIIFATCVMTKLTASTLQKSKIIGLGTVSPFWLTPGDVGTAFALALLPETVAMIASLMSYGCMKLSPKYVSADQRLLQGRQSNRGCHTVALCGALVIACTAFGRNVFSFLYHLSALVLIMAFAWTPRVRGTCVPQADCSCLCTFKVCVVATNFLHIVTYAICGSEYVTAQLPSSVLKLLGSSCSGGNFLQCLVAFLLTLILKKESLQTSSNQREVNEDSQKEPEFNPQLCNRDNEDLRSLSPIRLSISAREAASPSSVQAVSCFSTSLNARLGIEVPQDVESRCSTSRGTSLGFELPQDSGQTGSEGCVSMIETSARSCALCCTTVVFSWAADVSTDFLSLTSLLLWPIMWPCLPTLFLLILGMLSMQVPLTRWPRCFAHGIFSYEIVCSLSLYGYNVYCDAFGEPELSSVRDTRQQAESLGMQRYARHGGASVHLRSTFYIAAQTIAVLAFAAVVRAVTAPSLEHGVKRSNSMSQSIARAVLRNTVAYARPLAIVCILATILAPANASLIGLGYIMWLIVLIMVGCRMPFAKSGWDVLRAHESTWRGLSFYSSAVVVGQFIWQLIATDDHELLGLGRAQRSSLDTTFPHFCVAMLASFQARALRMGVLQPSSFVTSTSALARLLWVWGSFIQIAFMFLIVMKTSYSIDSFIVLLFFIITVGVEQIRPMSLWRTKLLVATASAAGTLLPMSYIAMMPFAQRCAKRVLSQATYEFIQIYFALSDTYSLKLQVAAHALLLVLSCGLRRIFMFAAASVFLDARNASLLRKWPSVVRFISGISEWSTCILMFGAYFLMLKDDALSRVQVVALLILLVTGRSWEYAGAFISASSMTLLLARYTYALHLIPWFSPEQATYWGLEWKPDAVSKEVSLLVLGIVQRVMQRIGTAMNYYERPTSPSGPYAFRCYFEKEVKHYAAQIGICLLLFSALAYKSAWSCMSFAIIIAFRFSGDSARILAFSRSNSWLRLIAGILFASLVYSLWFDIGPPPNTIPELTGDLIAGTWLCEGFCDSACSSQHECGQVWLGWIYRSEDTYATTSNFVVFFIACLLRRFCKNEMQKTLQDQVCTSSTQTATLGGNHNSDGSSIGADGSAISAPSSSSVRGTRCPWPYAVYVMAASTLWMSLFLLVVTSPPQTDVIVVGYMVMFCVQIALESAYRFDATFQARTRALFYARAFNLYVLALAVFSQCPFVPCPFELSRSSTSSTEAAFFMHPSHCVELQEVYERNYTAYTNVSATSLLLQGVGLRKALHGFGIDWRSFLNLVIYVSLLVMAIVCERSSDELSAMFEERKQWCNGRETWYTKHVTRWRHLELSKVSIKHQVILRKLQCLTKYLREVRSVWTHRRGPITEEEKKTYDHEVRVLDLSLKSGISAEVVEQTIDIFDREIKSKLSPERMVELDQAWCQLKEEMDSCVLERLELCKQRRLQHISQVDEMCRMAKLLSRCTAAAASVVNSTNDDESVGASKSDQSMITSPSPKLIRHARNLGRHIEEMLKYAAGWFVNDLIFADMNDDTLHRHRHCDSVLSLMWKACMSQTFAFLFFAAVLQFTSYMSVLASVTVSAAVLSLMIFPNPPAYFWKFLQVYNFTVIVGKLMYQLPIIPLQDDPKILPWESVLGFLKVVPSLAIRHNDLEHITCSTTFSALWADLLVCVALFCHWHMLHRSGRLVNPDVVRKHLHAHDCMDLAPINAPRQVSVDSTPSQVSPQTTGATYRRQLQRRMSSSRLWQRLVEPFCNCACQTADSVVKAVAGGSQLRKPARDLYIHRTVLLGLCFCIVLVFWNTLVGSRKTFAESLTNNTFSWEQVLVVVLFLAVIVLNRAEYTWYTQYRWQTDTSRPNLHDEIQGPSQTIRMWMPTLQKIGLIIQLMVLHIAYITRWSNGNLGRDGESFAMTNTVQALFYILYLAYLALTSMQMKYDIHTICGGLGFTHSTDLLTNIMFKCYLTVPFLEEIRVLTDWTVTKTSMDYFMWMKLECAQQNLYRTKRDMELRREIPHAAPRPGSEKIFQGGCLLLGLIALIVGPIMFFSTLNPTLQANKVVKAEFTTELVVNSHGSGEKSTLLFQAGQESIYDMTITETSTLKGMDDMDIQKVTFPVQSDNFWLISQSLQSQLVNLLDRPRPSARSATISFKFQFFCEGVPNSVATKFFSVALDDNRTQELKDAINGTNVKHSTPIIISIPSAYENVFQIDPSMKVATRGGKGQINLQLISYTEEAGRVFMPQWRLTSCLTEEDCSQLQITVASEKVSPYAGGPGQGSGSSDLSVLGLYLGVVYTIGRLLRLVFQDASKRIIYEELPDTSLLFDLCNGIYIARIQGLLDTEYKLYYQLIHIYRSPELLLDVSRCRSESQLDAHSLALASADDASIDLGSKIDALRRRRKAPTLLSANTALPETAASDDCSAEDAGTDRCARLLKDIREPQAANVDAVSASDRKQRNCQDQDLTRDFEHCDRESTFFV